MTHLKPKIFIGSSSAGYSVAEEVKRHLSKIGDCYLWKEADIWETNCSTFNNLIRMSNYFDFGVFIATADDLTLTNEKVVTEPRDNVILEMALFLGAMGENKSFLIVENNIKLPTDFQGIYMPRFDKNDSQSIEVVCNAYMDKIEEYFKLGHLSLYPTTALAFGYYKNFIEDLVSSSMAEANLEYNGIIYTDFKLKVVIPKDLKGLINEKANIFYKKHGFVENQIKSKFRSHNLWFHLNPNNAPNAIMYDMPSTLTGIDVAIELILKKSYKGRTKIQEIIEQKELFNFQRVLQMQIDNSPFAKEIVEIIEEF